MIARELLVDTDTKVLVENYMRHEAYMMFASCQSYTTCCSATVVTPRATIETLVMVVDTDLLLQRATRDLLHSVRKCSGRKIKTLAGHMSRYKR